MNKNLPFKTSSVHRYIFGVLCILQCFALSAQHAFSQTLELPVETVVDKIRGGLLGQILGNLNGLEYEFAFIHAPGDVKNYVPELLSGAYTDDDTDFEWVYIVEMQKHRNVFLPYDEVYRLWQQRINRRIWCANRYARHLMDLDLMPPLTGNVLLNPWADFNISGQFLSETFGLLAPAMPQTAARIGLHYTQVAIDGEPAQTTQMFTAMIATGFVSNDIDEVIAAGLSALDPNSRILAIAEDMKAWHAQYPEDWKKTRQLLWEKYTQENNRIRDTNGSELNTGAILGALLYGRGDFSESLKLAFNFGWDADNNAAQVGTIIGVMDGYRSMMANGWRIVDRYKNTTRDNMPMDETITSFADRLVELFELVNNEKGGTKKLSQEGRMIYEIQQERPQPVTQIMDEAALKQAILKEQPLERLIADIRNGDNNDKARAAYIAVCLDLHETIQKQYPREWEEAKRTLSGYVKVMNNIFYGGDFKALFALAKKFRDAGFKSPTVRLTDEEVYSDLVWKEPADLY
ncbi:MAG TPA: ADP-ribosylglycohydrolase family protein [Cyclobacteriaceae bacterium]|nr:ADP-ribosylglycohydrolase family protein [Cyclobacteriaceae bacterium]